MLITENGNLHSDGTEEALSLCLSVISLPPPPPIPHPSFFCCCCNEVEGTKKLREDADFFFFNDQPRVVFSFPEVFLWEIYLF